MKILNFIGKNSSIMKIIIQIFRTLKTGRIFRHLKMFIKLFIMVKNPSLVFKNLFFGDGSDFMIFLKKGGKVLLKSTELDVGMFIENYIGNNYLKHGIKIKNGDIVIDFGANKGFFGLSILSKYKDIKYNGYEPVSSTFEYLKKNIYTFNQNYIKIYNEGVSDKTTKAKIFFPGEDGANTIINNAWYNKKELKYETINLVDINKIMDNFESVDLVKIDIEGAEWSVFNKITEFNLTKIKQIAGEIHYINLDKNKLLKGFHKKLVNNGFLVKIVDETEIGGNFYAINKSINL